MSTATFLVGDVRERMAELEDGSFDFILCSPPFLALRSYLPPDHPDKAKEIGSESTPAEFIDVLLDLTAEWGRLLAPHGSIAIELGDSFSGSGGAGGDYGPEGIRVGQPKFRQQPPNKSERFNADGSVRTSAAARATEAKNRPEVLPMNGGAGWPLDKSLACIPQLYQVALAYGINPLTGDESPAGRWRVRNLKPWIRSNPPVGALGDKERPATSYVVVATRERDRWFDLDAVRTAPAPANRRTAKGVEQIARSGKSAGRDGNWASLPEQAESAGAPPRDWWHHVDAVLDAELAARRAGPPRHATPPTKHGKAITGDYNAPNIGAQGVHLRRALERAGILTTLDALDVSPKGYSGAHYAVWPPELVRLLVDEMCPRRVCVTCGEPSRRITQPSERYAKIREAVGDFNTHRDEINDRGTGNNGASRAAQMGELTTAEYETVGWSDCGHGSWRPGRILDPFVGSGTTLAVATGMGRDATGIDIDERNADLARERVGLFLDVDQPREAAS